MLINDKHSIERRCISIFNLAYEIFLRVKIRNNKKESILKTFKLNAYKQSVLLPAAPTPVITRVPTTIVVEVGKADGFIFLLSFSSTYTLSMYQRYKIYLNRG